jgi:DNA-binding beta-propeller fold protein YncE
MGYMKYFNHLIYTAVAVSLLLSATILVAPLSITDSFKMLQQAQAAGPIVQFTITDKPGSWFRSEAGPIGATQSLALAAPGTNVHFSMSETNTVHTITSLLWPTGADNMPFDQPEAFHGNTHVKLNDPGLYVFVCKLHPFMLGAVIVDDPATTGLDLGETIDLVNGITNLPTDSDLALRLVKAFYVITGPANWQDFTTGVQTVDFPSVDVRIGENGGSVVNLDVLDFTKTLPALSKPTTNGVGQVWVDTQYEETAGKTKPGTMTVVDATTWQVTKKVALPEINMNNPHNMWTNANQDRIYQTQWFDKYLTTVDRETGNLISNIEVGEAPAHVMTRVDTDAVHVSLNGEDSVVELAAGGGSIIRNIDVSGGDLPAQPHAHWMGFDGQTMVTPNSNTGDSTYYKFGTDSIFAKPTTGVLPIASGIMPDSSKYYVSNFLSNTISVISMKTGLKLKDINLLEDYNPITGEIADGAYPFDDPNKDNNGVTAVGALPIQTPVAPNGKFVVTANTLTATITIIDTKTDQLVKMLECDAGCHGVNFGAKQGGGYYAYVTSKFANTLLVVDVDPNNDGRANDATVVGRILLDSTDATDSDDTVTAYSGMGGQGVLAIPLVYNGWIQKTVGNYGALSPELQDWICGNDGDGLNASQRDPNGNKAPNITTNPC